MKIHKAAVEGSMGMNCSLLRWTQVISASLHRARARPLVSSTEWKDVTCKRCLRTKGGKSE